MECPITKNNCQTVLCNQQRECAMQKGVGYSDLQQKTPDGLVQSPLDLHHAHAHADSTAAAQADALEAHSLKYHHCAQIFQLSSGNFALFGAFANGEGIPLIAIGTWAELEPHVQEYRKQADLHAARPRPMKVEAKAKPSTAYDDLFGDDPS